MTTMASVPRQLHVHGYRMRTWGAQRVKDLNESTHFYQGRLTTALRLVDRWHD